MLVNNGVYYNFQQTNEVFKMAYRKPTNQETTVTTEKEVNDFYLNLEFNLPNGMSVPLNSGNHLTISLDRYLGETKTVNTTDSDWGKQQLIRNSFISALNEIAGQMDEGEVVSFSQLMEHPTMAKLLPLLGFSIRKRGKASTNGGTLPTENELDSLLGL